MDTKINGLEKFSNISGVNNKIAQINKQNRLKQSLSRHLLLILFNLIIYNYTTKKSQLIKTGHICDDSCNYLGHGEHNFY